MADLIRLKTNMNCAPRVTWKDYINQKQEFLSQDFIWVRFGIIPIYYILKLNKDPNHGYLDECPDERIQKMVGGA